MILCADDFGLTHEINTAILELAQAKKLSAISCMTTQNAWHQDAPELLKLDTSIQLGLHFNVTESHEKNYQASFQPIGLQQLILKSLTHRLSIQNIVDELKKQLDIFIETIGRAPDFIDGHQHIHQLPQVRTALLRIYQAYFPNKNVWIRVSANPLSVMLKNPTRYSVKHWILQALGAHQLRKTLAKHDIPHNRTFSGIYNFELTPDYSVHFNDFLNQIEDNGLIMCHPGKPSNYPDPIAQARLKEYEFFKGDQFANLK